MNYESIVTFATIIAAIGTVYGALRYLWKGGVLFLEKQRQELLAIQNHFKRKKNEFSSATAKPKISQRQDAAIYFQSLQSRATVLEIRVTNKKTLKILGSGFTAVALAFIGIYIYNTILSIHSSPEADTASMAKLAFTFSVLAFTALLIFIDAQIQIQKLDSLLEKYQLLGDAIHEAIILAMSDLIDESVAIEFEKHLEYE